VHKEDQWQRYRIDFEAIPRLQLFFLLPTIAIGLCYPERPRSLASQPANCHPYKPRGSYVIRVTYIHILDGQPEREGGVIDLEQPTNEGWGVRGEKRAEDVSLAIMFMMQENTEVT